MTRRPFIAAVCVCALAAALGASTSAHAPKGAPQCRVFPKNNPWNQRVDRLPVLSSSAAIVRSIGSGGSVHADFGAGLYGGAPIGIPFTTVKHSQRKVHVSFDYADES